MIQSLGDLLSVEVGGVALLTLLLLLLAGFAAGWVDAVVGGGGLLQLPALLMVPGITPVQALATNKLGSIFGTTTSAITYARRVRPSMRTALPMAFAALLASYGGAVVAASLPEQIILPLILVALIGVGVFTAVKPNVGQLEKLRHTGISHLSRAVLIGMIIGFYDGVLGPGTGTFLIIALVTVLGYSFLNSSAQAKVVNVATNLGALLFFAPAGHVLVVLGLLLGVANMLGGYVGARMAIAKGSKFIRVVFLIVVFALVLKLGYDVLAEWGPWLFHHVQALTGASQMSAPLPSAH
ncbi:TSUP family transporter [Nesterenkonia massiliensis]|uniref:Probable membrane transporter protein n=1 Tax=Nesterenkonia massiliensis TaxID=1232429 RepID=A0ABT2HMG8_9MICC|nr:TSUP family transporter [Nesterenkonia massiliensis]MCT1605888.1 TSUP family transporter [Nesterenkonia massiliensis]